MKAFIYVIISACLIFSSCKSDVKPVSDTTPASETPTKNNRDDGPVFTMVDKSKSNIPVVKADTIDVSSIEEIVSKANHNTALRLKKGKYKLANQLVYYITKDKKEIIDKNKVSTRSIGGQIYISGMTNFSIIGNGSEIQTENQKATPLYIYNAEQGILKDLVIGKKNSNQATSKAPCIFISGSNKVTIDHCSLGNNSRLGLKINDSKFLTFTDCKFSGAKEKIIEVIKGKSIEFINSTFDSNSCVRGCFDFLGNENSVEFKNSVIKNNKSIAKSSTSQKQLITGPSQNVFFRNSKFLNNNGFDAIGVDDFNLTESEVQKF